MCVCLCLRVIASGAIGGVSFFSPKGVFALQNRLLCCVGCLVIGGFGSPSFVTVTGKPLGGKLRPFFENGKLLLISGLHR